MCAQWFTHIHVDQAGSTRIHVGWFRANPYATQTVDWVGWVWIGGVGKPV
jgi:hypothetical protein